MIKKDVYNLTNPQKNIWHTEQYYKGTSINNICGSVIINEKTDLTLLSKAINKFIENNDSFKIRIKLIDAVPVQYFISNENYDFEVLSFNSIKELNSYANKMVGTPFELIESQLFDFKLFKLPNGFGGFIINAHHIISDAATFGIIGPEVISNYSKLKNNEEIKPKEFGYINYINSEEKYLNSSRFEKDKAFWNEHFKEIPSAVSIPSLKSTKELPDAKRLEFEFDKNLLSKITAFCKKNSVTVYNFLLAVYSLCLGRINSTSNFNIGIPILNRTNYSEKHTSGMFITTSMQKILADENLTILEFMQNVAKDSIAIFRHQKYDFQYILEDLRKQNKNITNLYDIFLSYQITKATDSHLSVPYTSKWYMTPYINNSINIHFHDNNDEGNLLIDYDYRICKYEEENIINFHKIILCIIDQILKNPNTYLKNIQLLNSEERTKIINDFNKTTVNYNKDKTLSMMFEEQVEKTPNNTAIVFENQKLTYKELNDRANSLAAVLRSQYKINKNDLVGIMVDRSLEMIISILAVLKSGGAYIPIDPTYPKDRIDYMLENSKSKLLLTQKKLNDIFNYNNSLLVDLSNQQIYSNKVGNIKNINTPEDLSYVIYTSGSTGKPKGVMLKHKALTNLTNYCNNYIDYLKNPFYKTIVSITTISFDIFIFETLISLQKGLKIVIANENEQTSPKLLNELMKKHNVKIIQSTPSRMQLLLNNISHIPSLKNLEYITLAGEQLPKKLVDSLKKLCNPTIYNGYGPSETTVFSTLTKMNSPIITIGKPLYNTQIYILDSNLNPLPIGIAGEIYISGDGVGKGYLNNDALTKKSFIKNPFIPNTIMYKTGDLGLYTNSGDIICLGRSDNQVKIRGLRIELEEIENRISKHANVKTCVVVKTVDEQNHEFLCAYYTADTDINKKHLRNYLEIFLPRYMVPSYFIQLDELPYTPNGKIDRKNLPEPDFNNNEKIEVIPPRNNTDSKLISILNEILKTNTISIDNDFFELGGDSLSAITLCIYIQDIFNTQLTVKDILEHSIIKDLSDFISKNKKSDKQTIIKPVQKADYYEVSSAQKRIYYASNVSGENTILYNIPGGIIIDGDIDKNKLELCINQLIKRHESLRTYFELIDNQVVQKIVANYTFSLKCIENANFEDLDTIYKKLIKPFDLSTAPLFRATLIKFSNGKSSIFIDMHHIISDGSSIEIISDELCKLYREEALDELDITYKDFSNFENKQLTLGKFDESKNYWINQFNDEIPVLNMPTNHPRPAVQTFEGKRLNTILDKSEAKKIYDFSTKMGITPYMTLLSCYYILLQKYTSQDDIIVGTPIVNREFLQTNSLIGMFVNTLAIRKRINTSNTFKDFVIQIKNQLLDAYKYQSYPFDELVNNLNIKRDTSRNPIFDTMFIYQNNGYTPIDFNNKKTTYYIPDTGISKFDLSLEVIPENDTINLSFEYSTKLFENNFIEDLSNHYINIIKTVTQNSDIKISDIDILSDNEKNIILNNFNNTSVDFEKINFVELFEKIVSDHPDKTAIVFENQKICFKELNEKANKLANYLLQIGTKNEDTICIVLNRSIELIYSIYGIIKSGASYIIIDPDLPKDRINYIIKNSNAKHCIVNDKTNSEIDPKLAINIEHFDYSNYSSINISNINYSDNLCIIYTSGSTGNPKGVILHKHGFVNLVQAFDNDIEISKYSSFLGLANTSFDMFVFTLFNANLHGNTFVLPNDEQQKNPSKINELIQKENVEFLVTTPSLLELLLDNNKAALSNIKGFVIGGEKFTSDLYNSISSTTNGKIYNGYGPTEITACCTVKQFTSDKDLTIGKPISNVQAYICDENLKLQPIGVIGEICIAGQGVAYGYLNNESATKKAFVNNPYGEGLLYKTGDLGKFTDDGEIEYIGRADNQIKIRGLRIELGEIESLIKKYPGIKKAVVIKQTINKRDLISAYYIANKNIEINKLRSHLSSSLPKYMVPSYFIEVDDFKYTANGKIDKKSLPISDDIYSISKKEYVAPKTDLQIKLANIWQKILSTEKIGINDNFFELGGDSLLAMNLNVELTKISKNITYQDIFRYPTIAELEEKIRSNSDVPFFDKIENLSDNFVNILENNNNKTKFKKIHPKGVLITGATGFLGSHVLEQFIKHEKCNIYCIVREGTNTSSRTKLYNKLHYYFGDKYTDLIDNKIFAVTGNVTSPGFGLNQEDLINLSNEIDVVINCAANVSHFGNYNEFYNSNVTSVKNAIDFCKNFNKKLYHISTISIADTKLDLTYLSYKKKNEVFFDESYLYVGQKIENIYSRTKFEAECNILNAVSNGLDGYILRMGNLMPRYRDGLFQENIADNEFINRIISFIKIGMIPDYLQEYSINFTPIDYSAKAIYKLATHPNQTNRIFHIYNKNNITVNKLLSALNNQNYKIKIVSEDDFKKEINKILNNEKTMNLLKNLLNDMDKHLHLNYKSDIIIKSDFTNKYLIKTFFRWPKITNKYLTRFINLLKKEL